MGEKMSDKKENYITALLNFCVSRIKLRDGDYFDSVREIEDTLSKAYDQGYSDANKEMRELLILEKNKNEHIENLTTSKADLFKREDFSNE